MSPAAEFVLEVGLSRALEMVRAGHRADAVRALTVAQDTANLVDTEVSR